MAGLAVGFGASDEVVHAVRDRRQTRPDETIFFKIDILKFQAAEAVIH